MDTTFDDLEDENFGQDMVVDQRPATNMPMGGMYKERCEKCRGTGRWGSYGLGRPCFACKGKGFKEFKTPSDQRAKAKVRSQAVKAKVQASIAEAVEAFKAEHPAEMTWMATKAGSFDFANSMFEALHKYGNLTEKQFETVVRLTAKDAERQAKYEAEKAEREANAPKVTIDKIAEAFSTAKASGIKSPKLRLADFKFSLAPAHGVNAGAIYVKRGEEYLGKVSNGTFKRAFHCDEVTENQVVEVISDPEAADVAYGKRFGQCSCCGRELSNQESIDRGIGPICAQNFGW